jgi:hypothetical protein
MFVALSTAVCAPLKAQQLGATPLSKAQLEQLVAPVAIDAYQQAAAAATKIEAVVGKLANHVDVATVHGQQAAGQWHPTGR